MATKRDRHTNVLNQHWHCFPTSAIRNITSLQTLKTMRQGNLATYTICETARLQQMKPTLSATLKLRNFENGVTRKPMGPHGGLQGPYGLLQGPYGGRMGALRGAYGSLVGA